MELFLVLLIIAFITVVIIDIVQQRRRTFTPNIDKFTVSNNNARAPRHQGEES